MPQIKVTVTEQHDTLLEIIGRSEQRSISNTVGCLLTAAFSIDDMPQRLHHQVLRALSLNQEQNRAVPGWTNETYPEDIVLVLAWRNFRQFGLKKLTEAETDEEIITSLQGWLQRWAETGNHCW